MARVVLYLEVLDDIDTEPVMRDLAEGVARDARALAAKGKTGRLAGGIRVEGVTRTRAVIYSTAKNPRSSPEHAEYPFWVEKGTSDTRPRPYLRPAAYRYRT